MLDDAEIETFINENKNVNIRKKTKAHQNVLRRWYTAVKEERDLKTISDYLFPLNNTSYDLGATFLQNVAFFKTFACHSGLASS